MCVFVCCTSVCPKLFCAFCCVCIDLQFDACIRLCAILFVHPLVPCVPTFDSFSLCVCCAQLLACDVVCSVSLARNRFVRRCPILVGACNMPQMKFWWFKHEFMRNVGYHSDNTQDEGDKSWDAVKALCDMHDERRLRWKWHENGQQELQISFMVNL